MLAAASSRAARSSGAAGLERGAQGRRRDARRLRQLDAVESQGVRAHGVVAVRAHIVEDLRAPRARRRAAGAAAGAARPPRRPDRRAGPVVSRRSPPGGQVAQAGRRARPARRCAARARRDRPRGACCFRPRRPRRRLERACAATPPRCGGAPGRSLDQRHHAVGQPVGGGAIERSDDLDDGDLDAARREVRARESRMARGDAKAAEPLGRAPPRRARRRGPSSAPPKRRSSSSQSPVARSSSTSLATRPASATPFAR